MCAAAVLLILKQHGTNVRSLSLSLYLPRSILDYGINYYKKTAHKRLNNDADILRWKLHQNGKFSIHSLYLALISFGVIARQSFVESKNASKNKFFMRYMYKGMVLREDNLVRRNWEGSKKCSYF
jgi:hypothetical protein